MAFGNDTFTDIGGGVSDIFAGFGDQAKAQGDFAEATEYSEAATLAGQNEAYTKTSTAIKEAQQSRELTMTLGGQKADVAGAGFAESGSALDLLRDSASQGALTHAVLGQQGLITEAGYQEQQESYNQMSAAATAAGNAANQASTFADITGVIKGVAGLATLFTGGAAAPLAAAATVGLDGLDAVH
jgi:hypothetical protein